MSISMSRKFTGALVMLGCLPVALASDQPASRPGKGAEGVVIGQVLRSDSAFLNGVAAPADVTLTSGSTLKTASRGTALVKFSADTQADLSENTSVRFDTIGGRVSARLSSGTMAAESSHKDELVVETPRLSIEPAEGKAAYVVALLPNDTTIVSARQGDISVTETSSGKKHLVPAGHHARISNAPAGMPAQAGSAAAAAPPGLLNNTPLVFVIAVGAGVGVGLGVGEGALSAPASFSGPASPSAP